jgi:hypothetical protein
MWPETSTARLLPCYSSHCTAGSASHADRIAYLIRLVRLVGDINSSWVSDGACDYARLQRFRRGAPLVYRGALAGLTTRRKRIKGSSGSIAATPAGITCGAAFSAQGMAELASAQQAWP